MSGGGTGAMTKEELHMLEKNLELWIYHIRTVKVILYIPFTMIFQIL